LAMGSPTRSSSMSLMGLGWSLQRHQFCYVSTIFLLQVLWWGLCWD
jgi:hypothetical protein